MKTRRYVIQAIADPTGSAIPALLATQTMTAGAIASNIDSARPTISKHIQILIECELLEANQQGREIHYQLKIDKMKEIDKWLEQFREIWENRFGQLDSLLAKIKNKKMKSKLQFDFLVDKEIKTISVTKEFAASRNLVWSAWTEPDLLDQWWAPTPWKVSTKTMEI